jgi:acetylornithine deacetylase/succinyl-diaminopimelate desuccinylase-like protein
MNVFEYADSHRAEFLSELKDLLRIPSISTLPDHVGDIQRAANWVAEHLRQVGMTTVQVYPTEGHPIVYGEWLGAPGAPTVLIYGHYDVQPTDPDEEWLSPPFDPTERDGNLYARGATDDKGQVFANIKSVQSFMQTRGKLPVNVKFLIEGEEEISSAHLDPFIQAHQDLLRADVAVISDSHILGLDRPSILYGLRGLVYMELEVKGPRVDLHSGAYGGSVHNPAQVLCEIVAALHKPDGSVAVPGFYDKVRALDPAERKALGKIAYTEEQWQRETGAPHSWGEAGYTLLERHGARPTLEVNGLVSGFTGKGAKTVLPAKALAKISCRLVPDQDPHQIEDLFRKYVQSITPPTVTSEVRGLNYAPPSVVPIDSPAIAAAVTAYERGFGATPMFMREGGSIPVVATLQEVFHIPVLLVGFGLPDDSTHAPNEKFTLECFYRGITTSITLFEELSKLPRA